MRQGFSTLLRSCIVPISHLIVQLVFLAASGHNLGHSNRLVLAINSETDLVFFSDVADNWTLADVFSPPEN